MTHDPSGKPYKHNDEQSEAAKADWAEDFSGENGSYQNTCIKCGMPFLGHKRRMTCKLCASPRSLNLQSPRRMTKIKTCEECGESHWDDKPCPTCSQRVLPESLHVVESNLGVIFLYDATGIQKVAEVFDRGLANEIARRWNAKTL